MPSRLSFSLALPGFPPPPKKLDILGLPNFRIQNSTYFNLYLYCTGQSEAHDQWRSQLIARISRADRSFNPQSAKVCSRHFEEHCFVTRKRSLFVAKMWIFRTKKSIAGLPVKPIKPSKKAYTLIFKIYFKTYM